MKNPSRWSEDNLLSIAAIMGKTSVRTQYACEVVGVSQDGRFVNVIHNTLEWETCSDGDTIMINEFGKDVLCTPTKPWVLNDIPVEETYVRGQWKVRVRPKIGDRGILSVFYHDTRSLKEKGGFQAPDAIRIMAIDSASFRPGLPNHADVNAETDPYPTDDEWELQGNGVKVKLTSPVDGDSQSPNKMEVNVGTVSFTITVPQDGTPTVVFDAPNGSITVNSKSATVNTEDATLNTTTSTVNSTTSTVTASTSVTIDTPATTITGNLNVGGAVLMASTLGVTGVVTTGAAITSGGSITAPGLAITGTGSVTANSISATGTISAPTISATTEVTAAGISLSTHKHSGVTSGPDNTGTPVA